MNLTMIAEKLEEDLVGKIGKTIFVNHMPVGAVPGILLRPPYVGTPIDYELPGYRKTRFSAAVRGKTYQQAEALVNAVMESLTLSETQLTGAFVNYVRPLTEPVPFPVSDGGNVEFLVLFEANYVILT